MPFVAYNLDNALDSFFADAGASTSRAECDAFARQRYGGQIWPVDIQGTNSYTVVAGLNNDKIIQFREQTALLDTSMLELAKDIHGHLVPSCSEVGRVGNVSGLQLVVYEMDRLPGENCVTARFSLACSKQLNIVHGLASFFTQAWQKSIPVTSGLVDMSSISIECYARFKYLAEALPKRFLPAVAEVQAALPLLLDGAYPVVLTHADLNEMNILINPNSGQITGIVDWSSASIQPFGFALYALENALGGMRVGGWEWHNDADELRVAFWKVFREQTGLTEPQLKLLRLAGKAGILMRYGIAYNAGFSGLLGVRDPEIEDFRHLDALI